MGKQSPNKRKSEVNSNETPKKAKVAVDTPKTPVNSPVKQTPQKNNKTPKSQKKQKPQTPAKEAVMNGVASKKVQITENNQVTPASTPAKGKGEKKYPVTPGTKGNVAKSPKNQEKAKKTPPGTPNKQNEGKLEKFTGVKSLDGSTATSPAKNKKKKNKTVPSTDVAEGLTSRKKRRMLSKLRKASLMESKKTNAGEKGSDFAANKSIKEIAENVAGGEKPMTKNQKKKLKKMQKLATAANAETTNKAENNSVQLPKAKKNKKKGKKEESDVENKEGKQADPKDLNNAGILTKGQSKYVIYVGNLSFDATKEQIMEHFNKVCEVKDVRIPTDKQTNKPKGFAFLEVPNEESYHKALALHLSFVNQRRIFLNTEKHKKNIESNNFKVQAMRRDGKLPGGVKDSHKRFVRRANKRSFDKNTE